MAEAENQLAFVTTEELCDELKRRCRSLIVAGVPVTDTSAFFLRFAGDTFEMSGMARAIRMRLDQGLRINLKETDQS